MATQLKPQQASATAILSSLHFGNASPPAMAAAQQDPVHRRRDRFVASCQLQLDILKSEMEGKVYSAMRKHYIVVKGPDGEPVTPLQKKLVEEPTSKFRKWYFLSGDTYSLLPRYSVRVVEIVKDQPAIVCGKKLADVAKVLETLINATKAGELDRVLAAIKLGRRGE
jgi:hypothetical protein